MSSKPGRSPMPVPRQQPVERDGEGTYIEIQLDQFIADDGNRVANIGINLAQTPVPDRKYVADACAVTCALGTVKIMFGQERVGRGGWRSLLVIQMPLEAAARFLGTLSQPGGALTVSNPVASKYGTETLTTDVVEPEGQGQAITLGANIGFVALNENEACLDFYYASPFSLMNATQTKKLALDPVVRVYARSSLFLAMAKGLEAVGVKPVALKTKTKEGTT